MSSRDSHHTLPCGCFWERDSAFGDVLFQCSAHKAGAPYDGAQPMSKREFAEFADIIDNVTHGYLIARRLDIARNDPPVLN